MVATDEAFPATRTSPATRERAPDCRRHPRIRVTWPVTVEAGESLFHLETLNLSLFGAKVRLDSSRLEAGLPARLHFHPPAGSPLEVLAIVWRTDPDGVAFFFISVENSDLIRRADGSGPEPLGR